MRSLSCGGDSRVDQVPTHADPAVVVFSDDAWAVGFEFEESGLSSGFESGLTASFDPGVFHDFEFRSSDMRQYELYIDGSLSLTGHFEHVITASEVSWGAGVQGASSLSRWDCFEFGVIPEPSSLALIVVVSITACSYIRHAKSL